MEERDDRCAGDDDDDDDERILVRRRSVFGLCFMEDPLYLSARRSSAATCRLVFTCCISALCTLVFSLRFGIDKGELVAFL